MNRIKQLMLFFLFSGLLSVLIQGEDLNFGAMGAKHSKSPTLEQMLTYAIQDEYLARAEYIKIIDLYGEIRPFANILKAEIYHVSLLVPLFKKYNFSVPVDNAADFLMIPEDLKTALEIGVQAEIENIAMYEFFLKQDLPDDVKDVFLELKKASLNHLKAFKKNVEKY